MKLAVLHNLGQDIACWIDGSRAVDLQALGLASRGPDPLLQLINSGIEPKELTERAAAVAHRGDGDLGSQHQFLHKPSMFRTPLRRPTKVIGVGLNYVDHTREAGIPPPTQPMIFAKFPSSIIGPVDDIIIDLDLSNQVDFEVELAAVIGRPCGPDNRGRLEDVFGYTVGNDVSARDIQTREGQWVRAKSFDTFCPLGPVIVTSDEIEDPSSLWLELKLNGRVQQEAPTSDMFFGLPRLLDWITAASSLEPGDVVLTGTPPGVGAFQRPPRFLRDGDVVNASISGIGEIRNAVKVRHSGAQR